MNKNNDRDYIYTLLNDIPENISDYPNTELTQEEFFKYRKNLRQNIQKRKKSRKIPILRYISIGAAACVILTLIVFLFDLKSHQERIRASSGTNYYSLSSMLGVSSELEDYALHIDENHSISKGSISLNSAALDAGQISIYSTYYFNETQDVPRLSNGGWWRNYGNTFSDTQAVLFRPDLQKAHSNPYNANYTESNQIPYIQRLFINGKEVVCEAESSLYASANGVLQDTATYFLSTENISFPAHVTMEIWESAADKEPETMFEFVLTKDNIVPDKKNINLQHTAVLPDGRTVTFKRFVYNALGMRIEAEYKGTASDRDRYGPVYLMHTDLNGSSPSLIERSLSKNRLFFYPNYIFSLYSQIDTMSLLEFSIIMYHYEDGAESLKRITLEEPLKIPLN